MLKAEQIRLGLRNIIGSHMTPQPHELGIVVRHKQHAFVQPPSRALASILFRAKVLRVACLCLKTVLDTSITTTSDKWTIVTVASVDKRLDL